MSPKENQQYRQAAIVAQTNFWHHVHLCELCAQTASARRGGAPADCMHAPSLET